jgi:hypothetical protein
MKDSKVIVAINKDDERAIFSRRYAWWATVPDPAGTGKRTGQAARSRRELTHVWGTT